VSAKLQPLMNSSVCTIAFNSLDHLNLGELMKMLIHNINPTRQNGLQLASTTFIQWPRIHQKKKKSNGRCPLCAKRRGMTRCQTLHCTRVGLISEAERIVRVCVLVKPVPCVIQYIILIVYFHLYFFIQ
jgi:hypothetical protein